MEHTECLICYDKQDRVVLAAAGSGGSQVLDQGDTLEVFEYGRFQLVTVYSGGYCGWYYLTAAGRPARFAIGMRTQNYRAKCSNISPVVELSRVTA
jgi:hypothetical protein